MGVLNSLNSLFKFSHITEASVPEFVIDGHYYTSPNQQEEPSLITQRPTCMHDSDSICHHASASGRHRHTILNEANADSMSDSECRLQHGVNGKRKRDIRALYESSFLNLFPGVNRISESGISSPIYTT